MKAFRLIYSINEGKRAVDLRALGTDYEDAAFILSSNFETMGFLVFRENIPFHLVEELIGGAAIKLWEKLYPWVEDLREEQGHPLLFEWFQWLVERLNEHGRAEQVPAYVQHRARDPRSLKSTAALGDAAVRDKWRN